MRYPAIALSLCLPVSAMAHDGLLTNGIPQDDFIAGLRNSDGVPCCGFGDCHRLEDGQMRVSVDGDAYEVEIEGEWFRVLEKYLLRDIAPDGRVWVCPQWTMEAQTYLRRAQGVRCLITPPGV